MFAAYRTLEIAAAVNLEPCFTPVESPESNGMAESFVTAFKRDYVRVNPIPDARTALLRIDPWMEDYNSEQRIPVWATAHRGSRLHHFFKPRVRSNGVNSNGKGRAAALALGAFW
jgi:hypothetical protein